MSIVRAINRKSRNPRSPGDEVALARSFWSKIHHFHIDHNTHLVYPCPPPPKKKMHKHCFQFLLGITVLLREIEVNGYAKFCGVNKVHYGLCKNREWPKISRALRRANSKRSVNKKVQQEQRRGVGKR